MTYDATPDELHTWTVREIGRLEERLRFLRDAVKLHADDPADWHRHAIKAASEIAEDSRDVAYLLSVYAAVNKLLPVSEVAELAGLARESMYQRMKSKEAQDLYRDIFS